jgi:hypothetical protein
MDDLAKDYPDEAWLKTEGAKPDFTVEPWHDFYWQAWHALRYDRVYAGMTGAEMPISFLSIDTYARRYGITGEIFDRLLRFVSAIDFAYLDIRNKAAARSQDKPTVKTNG